MKNLFFFLFIFFLFFLFSCEKKSDKKILKQKVSLSDYTLKSFDLDKIKKRGKLIALTRFNANTYFLYKGEPKGYEYELLTLFAKHLKVELEIIVPKVWSDIVPALYEGKGDIIAANLAITKERLKNVNFTKHHTTTRQVLVQKKPDNWRILKKHETEKLLIRNQIDLIGKKIHVRKISPYEKRLKNLSEEIGGEIIIKYVSGEKETENLIKNVSEGKIDYTIADENIALINKSYYPNIDIKTPISFPQRIAWAVRPNSPLLLTEINKWIEKMRTSKDPTYYVIYNKYYKNKKFFKNRIKSDYYTTKTGKISEYDSLIKKYAEKNKIDWRLLAAQIFQESRFNSKEKSWAGAKGLLQVLPKTGKQFGVTDLYDPEKNIKAGTDYLNWLFEYWKEIKDDKEKIKFVLASYNAGQGHIQDARRLCKKYGKDPFLWEDNVEFYIIKKNNKKFFNDSVVKFGYCRGEEPSNYVKEIFKTYEHYKKFIKIL